LDYFHLIILGLVQGLTEFLPISSSAHLILLPEIAGWQDQGLAYDIAAHTGSLIAVLVFFRKDFSRFTLAWINSLNGGQVTQDAQLFWYILLATIPVAVAGVLLYDMVATTFRNPLIIASASIMFGFLLWWADVKGRGVRKEHGLRLKDAIIIGTAQILSLVPGVSRSGITMTAGLMLGFDRYTSARISFYLAVPTILLASCYEVYTYFKDVTNIDMAAFLMIVVTSGVSAWLAIRFFIALIERTGMLPYVIYRVLLGLFLIVFFYD
jgi:undecaprenyl-diphosphatase